jgi:hypothetical protein
MFYANESYIMGLILSTLSNAIVNDEREVNETFCENESHTVIDIDTPLMATEPVHLMDAMERESADEFKY